MADRLTPLYEETGRSKDAKELAGEAKRAGPAYGSGVGVRRTVELVEGGDRAVVRDTATEWAKVQEVLRLGPVGRRLTAAQHVLRLRPQCPVVETEIVRR